LSLRKDVHTNVIEKLLVLFAIVLELKDENYFVEVSLTRPSHLISPFADACFVLSSFSDTATRRRARITSDT
jgi:hypothetical protein